MNLFVAKTCSGFYAAPYSNHFRVYEGGRKKGVLNPKRTMKEKIEFLDRVALSGKSDTGPIRPSLYCFEYVFKVRVTQNRGSIGRNRRTVLWKNVIRLLQRNRPLYAVSS